MYGPSPAVHEDAKSRRDEDMNRSIPDFMMLSATKVRTLFCVSIKVPDKEEIVHYELSGKSKMSAFFVDAYGDTIVIHAWNNNARTARNAPKASVHA